MVEMLVVIAITIVLMGLILGPLSQSFRLTARGRAMIAAQDNARAAMVQITRELQDAMVVYDGLPVQMYGYTNLQTLNNEPHPDSNSEAIPLTEPGTDEHSGVPLQLRDAMIDLVMPRSRYYCTKFDHYLTDAEVAPNQAITECPRPGHQNSPVESRPIQPLEPTGTRVRYFVGLRQGFNPSPLDPTIPGGTSPYPRYMNPLLFVRTGSEYNNPYVLYRVEFDPNDPATRNWQVLDAQGHPTGQINPNFFYTDPKQGDAFARTWQSRAVAVISPENTDMVRWVQEGGRWLPQPMTSFGATPIESETLSPIKVGGTAETSTGTLQAARVPMQYVAEYGHWTGPENDMSLPLSASVLMGPARPPINLDPTRWATGPRIQIYDARPTASGPAMNLVFDSALPPSVVPRRRLFTWDSSRGIVNFALRSEMAGKISVTGGQFGEVPYSVSLQRDQQTRDLPLVTNPSRVDRIAGGFGSLGAQFPDTLRIVPGSDLVQVLDNNGQPVRTFERAGWIGTGRDQIVAQADLDPNQYVIDYSAGVIMFSDRDPSLAGLPVDIRYQMQTNLPTDIVRVTYATRELFTLNVGLLQYEPGSGEAQEVQLTNRLRLRNLTR
jgi:hypothetical protein